MDVSAPEFLADMEAVDHSPSGRRKRLEEPGAALEDLRRVGRVDGARRAQGRAASVRTLGTARA
jgi:hypothetical protein